MATILSRPSMALWLQCQEAVPIQQSYPAWLEKQLSTSTSDSDAETDSDSNESLPDDEISTTSSSSAIYGAVDIIPAPTEFIKRYFKSPSFFPSSYDRFDIYTKITLKLRPNPYLSDKSLAT
ncbi:hypothetical protein B0H13DRAFT_2387713 [Mycena leptocephala]|nr:hypothetical protein B0H13DRAFT_2387713 [Mycena leptocephala]